MYSNWPNGTNNDADNYWGCAGQLQPAQSAVGGENSTTAALVSYQRGLGSAPGHQRPYAGRYDHLQLPYAQNCMKAGFGQFNDWFSAGAQLQQHQSHPDSLGSAGLSGGSGAFAHPHAATGHFQFGPVPTGQIVSLPQENKTSVFPWMKFAGLNQTEMFDDRTPSQILALAIRKRRKMNGSKDPDFRVVTVLGATIKLLCRHIGQERAAVKRPLAIDFSSSPVSLSPKRKRVEMISSAQLCAGVNSSRLRGETNFSTPNNNSCGEPMDICSNGDSSDCQYDESDPFGLDKFFDSLRSGNKSARG